MTEASLPEGVDLAIVDETIASGIRLLNFPRRLEIAFEKETGRQRCRELAIGAFIGLAMYEMFLLADWWVTPDIFVTALWVRLGLVLPCALIVTAAFYLNPPAFLRECMVVFGGAIFGTVTVLYLMLLSHSPHQDSQHQAVILIILFVTMVQRVRFWYSIPTCLACFLMHAEGLALLSDYPLSLQVSANTVFACVVVFSLVASYRLEREVRLNYLLSLRGRLQNCELDAISRRDPLTGLGNRRSLDEALVRWERDPGACEELSLVLFDIDHFKMFNDTLGHQAGDVCLKRVAGVIQGQLQGQLRDHADHAFRFGGEEFLVMLRATDLPAGVGIAERMRRAIEEAAIPHPAVSAGSVVTASFGVACGSPGNQISAAEIIAGADAALYAAKRSGRNQVWPRFLSALRSEIVDISDRKSQAG